MSSATGVTPKNTKIQNRAYSRPRIFIQTRSITKNLFAEIISVAENGSPRRNWQGVFGKTVHFRKYIFRVKETLDKSQGMTKTDF